MEDCKIIIDDLVEENLLVDIGKNSKESFKIKETENKGMKLPINYKKKRNSRSRII